MFLGIGLRLGMLGSVFSPANLFSSNEQGAWYDPSDLTTLFQDSAGTTPVTTAGQPVGLMLDKSQGLVLGPELVTNGDFATDSDWTKGTGWTIAGGVASFDPTGQGANSTISQDFSITWTAATLGDIAANGTYKYRATASDGASYSVRLTVSGMTVTGLGQLRIIVSGATFFASALNVRSFSGSIDNITVKLLPGNHATQATSSKRPTYQTAGGLHYLAFDGVDDFMVPSGMAATSGPVTVFCGAVTTNGETVARQYILDVQTGRWISALVGDVAGGSQMFDDPAFTAGSANWATESNGVVTFKHYASAGGIRVNGTELLTENVIERAIGGAIAIGSRNGGASNFVSGRLYSLIIRAASSNLAEISSTEFFIATKAGVTL
jgi:hypothetical protein